MTYKQWYLYGVTTASAAQYVQLTIMGGEIVEVVEVGELAILASEISLKKLGSPLISAHHESIGQALYQKTPFLPFVAHTIVPSKREAMAILVQNNELLIGKIQDYLRFTEFRVKVSWNDLDLVFKEISAITPGLADLYQAVKQSNDIEAIAHLGAMFDVALCEKKEEVAEIWMLELSKLANQMKNRKNMQDTVCFDSSFLVTHENYGQFKAIVEELKRRYQRTLSLHFEGPVPPGSFARLRLGKNFKLRNRKQEWLPEFL